MVSASARATVARVRRSPSFRPMVRSPVAVASRRPWCSNLVMQRTSACEHAFNNDPSQEHLQAIDEAAVSTMGEGSSFARRVTPFHYENVHFNSCICRC